jgi:hypothetical protein
MKRKIMCRVVVAAMVVSATGALASPSAWATKGIHNFGGYSAPVIATASADITVPATDTISCSSAKSAIVDTWVALTRGQYAANAGLVVKCAVGSELTYIAGAAGTLSFRFPVNGGDVISIAVSETATATTVTAVDTTTSVSDSANFIGATILPTIVQFGATSTTKTFPSFGSEVFSSAEVDGAPLGTAPTTLRKLTRSHPPNVVPGPISSGSFSLSET